MRTQRTPTGVFMLVSPRLLPLTRAGLAVAAAVASAAVTTRTARADDPPPASAPASDADVEPDQPGPPPSYDAPPTRDLAYTAETISGSYGDVRDNVNDWAVGPPGWDVGGELRLITSDQGLGDEPRLKLSDVGLLRARLRATASRRIETFGALDVLAKQPSYTDELVVQGATFGVKVAVTRRWALSTSLAAGPTLADSGYWGGGGTAMIYRSHPDQTLSFQVSAGASATALRLDDAGEDPWLTEVSAGGMIMIHSPNGWFGTWLGAVLNVPVVHSDGLEPGTRLDLTLGAVYAVVKEWDIYVEAGIFDRGDAGHPATQLPILDGGFDQRTIVIGVTRRFEGKQASHRRSGDALLQLGS
jgi:hypothetical protein